MVFRCGGLLEGKVLHFFVVLILFAPSCVVLLVVTLTSASGGSVGHAFVVAYLGAELALLFAGGCGLGLGDNSVLRTGLVRIVVVHALAAWWFVHETGVERGPSASAILVYVSHVLVGTMAWVARWRLHSAERRASIATDEAKELRVQNDALRRMRGSVGHDDYDSESDLGDDRDYLIQPPEMVVLTQDAIGKPEVALPQALHGRTFNRELALKIASKLRRRHYSLANYYEDVQSAFPELQLYLTTSETAWAVDKTAEGDDGSAALRSTSGLLQDDEYRRTIGAMFAVYWLMRVGIDGERGFSFGVDAHWRPHECWKPSVEEGKSDGKSSTGAQGPADPWLKGPAPSWKKRVEFYEKQDWARLQKLLVDAGMLEERRVERTASAQATAEVARRSRTHTDGKQAEPAEEGHVDLLAVCVERTVAMLALTAFHDVMKIEALLPRVGRAHAPFLGYQEGDVINDHDCALAYVLSHYSDLLPSFVQLTSADQLTVKFTQSRMQFNHGWLVQGEAPPSALFAKFKLVMRTEGVSPADVAFYFVHWLTDLAGAEPSPLGGAEKLVLKFPHEVLDSFVKSFSVINELAINTETRVMEAYLVRTWAELEARVPALGPVPSSPEGIALMRLVLQAQTPEKQLAIVDAWRQLVADDREVLMCEMARTGIHNQFFERAPPFDTSLGPSFLVYYSPAFLRKLAPAEGLSALVMLAEIYRRARKLWPLRPTESNDHAVTIRIDQIKELKAETIHAAHAEGETWLLCRKNGLEGVVEKHPVESVQTLSKSDEPIAVLKFWRSAQNRNHKDGSSKAGGSDWDTSSVISLSRGTKKLPLNLSRSNSASSVGSTARKSARVHPSGGAAV